MQIIPVLDLMDGQVVRGIGGRRAEYRPLVSRLTDSAEPLAVARAFRRRFGLDEVYLADLDAIGGKPPAYGLFKELLHDGFRLWVDAGLGVETTEHLAALGVPTIVAGLESLDGPEQLGELIKRFSAQRIVFSLDAKDGKPLGKVEAWGSPEVWKIAQQAVLLRVERMLVLDLAAVGENRGPSTLDLCRQLRAHHASLEITTGGGIRGVDDLRRLHQQHVNNVLVASAIHDERVTSEYLELLRAESQCPYSAEELREMRNEVGGVTLAGFWKSMRRP